MYLRFEALFVGFFCVVLGDCSGGCCVVCCSLTWFWFWVIAVGFLVAGGCCHVAGVLFCWVPGFDVTLLAAV